MAAVTAKELGGASIPGSTGAQADEASPMSVPAEQLYGSGIRLDGGLLARRRVKVRVPAPATAARETTAGLKPLSSTRQSAAALSLSCRRSRKLRLQLQLRAGIRRSR